MKLKPLEQETVSLNEKSSKYINYQFRYVIQNALLTRTKHRCESSRREKNRRAGAQEHTSANTVSRGSPTANSAAF